MYRLITVIFILFSFGLQCQTTLTGNIMHNGINRNFRLRLPANHDKNTAIPLVFNLHGFTSNAAQQEIYSGMNMVADTAGFAVCYPNGVGNAWNVGWSFGSTADDVGFISVLIDKFYADYGIDKARVYACGMSNGGFMSFRLACELNNRVAAIASVTGSMVKQALDACKPNKPVPVLQIHGTADPTVNYNGTPFISESIANLLGFWQKNNGCDLDPIVENLPNISNSDNTTVEKLSYQLCDSDKELIHYKVKNGGHTWPGSLVSNVGVTNQDINASVEIWNFFNKYRIDNLSTVKENEEAKILVYPNPADDFITLSNLDHANIIISNFGGQIIDNFNTKNETVTLSIENWVSGVYFVTIRTYAHSNTFRIVKI